MGNIGTDEDSRRLPVEWMICRGQEDVGTAQLGVDLHANVRAVLGLPLLNVPGLQA